MQIRFRVDLTPGCSIGPGKIQLLEAITRTGSLRRAATELRMSYRRAWLLLDELDNPFDEPATLATVGGAGAGVVISPRSAASSCIAIARLRAASMP